MTFPKLKFRENLKSEELWRAVVVEIFGTMLLVYVPLATIAVTVIDGQTIDEVVAANSSSTTPATDLPVNSRIIILSSMVIGFTIASLLLALGHVSNHINPVFSLSFFLRGYISFVRVLIFFVAQTIGATIGGLLLYATSPLMRQGTFMCTTVNPSVSIGEALGVEICTTMVLVFGTWTSFEKLNARGKTPGLPVIGVTFVLTMTICIGGPLTGGSMNPARSTGAALVMHGRCWDHHWIYWVGPLVGSLIGSFFTVFVYDWDPKSKETESEESFEPKAVEAKLLNEETAPL